VYTTASASNVAAATEIRFEAVTWTKMADQSPVSEPSHPLSLTSSSIYSLALPCLKSIENICDGLRLIEQENASQNGYDRNLVLLSMLDARAKFKAWGGNIAAFRKPYLSTSLDFRLKEAPEIRTRLLQVLEYLQEYLNDGLSPAKVAY